MDGTPVDNNRLVLAPFLNTLRSVCLAVHRLLTVHHLVRVSVNLRVKFKVRVRDMVKLKFMDHG